LGVDYIENMAITDLDFKNQLLIKCPNGIFANKAAAIACVEVRILYIFISFITTSPFLLAFDW
jgi:hypothetical protein